MSKLNIADVEDSFLNADLHDEWKEEFEKEFYRPISDIVMADLAGKITDEELADIKKQDPIAYMEIMEAKEKMEKFQERQQKKAGG